MPNLISCRPESYGAYANRAFESLPTLGIRHVEIAAPAPGKVAEVAARLKDHGLEAASVTMGAKIQQADFLQKVGEVVDSAAALGARVIFTSQLAGEMDRQEVYRLLREAGTIAGRKDLTIALETHPDLGVNARVAGETMKGVDHPHVRINFDPANIYYYNEGVDAVNELRQIAPYVRAVHLKDSNGGFRAHHFPAIGDGVVDWKSVFAIMNDQGIEGPFTLEMEGIAGESLTFEETHARIARSLDYLRSQGLWS